MKRRNMWHMELVENQKMYRDNKNAYEAKGQHVPYHVFDGYDDQMGQLHNMQKMY